MKRTVTVLQDDIDKGTRESIWACPVARAAARDLADLADRGYVTVGGSLVVRISDPHVRDLVFRLPEEAKAFVRRFDERGPGYVQPFKFEVETY